MEIITTLLCTMAILGSHMFFIMEIKGIVKMLGEIYKKINELEKR